MAVGMSSGRGAHSLASPCSPSASIERATNSHEPVSSAKVTLSSKIPAEILTQILSHVPFHELYGSCQYVDYAWRYVATRFILGNAVFMRKVVQTDYLKLFTTASGCDDDSMQDSRQDNRDDTWQGVALDTSTAGEYQGLADVKWRGRQGKKLYLILKEAYMTTESPYIIRAELLTFKEQYELYEEEYEQVIKLSLDQRRPVLLDVVDFDSKTAELHLDLSECYRAIYWEYRRSRKELRQLTESLEAALWTRWCQKHGRYWGKKREGEHSQGIFIDIVNSINERTHGLYGDLEAVFLRYDLYRRKVRLLDQMSLHNLARYAHLDFDDYYRQMTASWADADAEQSKTQIDSNTKAISFRHKAHFDRTLRIMIRAFDWHQPGNIADAILPSEEYAAMLQDWYEEMTQVWKQTRIVQQTTFHWIAEN